LVILLSLKLNSGHEESRRTFNRVTTAAMSLF